MLGRRSMTEVYGTRTKTMVEKLRAELTNTNFKVKVTVKLALFPQYPTKYIPTVVLETSPGKVRIVAKVLHRAFYATTAAEKIKSKPS